MGFNRGPKTSTRNIDVLYDTGNVKSYVGEPTTNLALFNIASSGFGTDTPSNLTQTSNDTEFTYGGRPSRKMVIGSGYWNCYIFSYNSGVSSAVFTVSFKVKAIDGSNPNTFIGGGYIYGTAGSFFPPPSFTAIDDGWYICYIRYSGTAMTLTSLTGVNGSGGPKTFYITDYQVEAKDHFTPFTTGTRTSTQGLIDLSRNKTIDLTNVSFDNNSNITFDGTNDYITISTRRQYGTNEEWTAELIINPQNTTQTSWNGIFGGNLNAGGYWMFHGGGQLAYYDGVYGGNANLAYTGLGLGSTFPSNTHTHLVIIYNGAGNYVIYVNGVVATNYNFSFGGSYSLDLQRIGGPSDRFGTVNVPYFKISSSIITSDEVFKNFMSIKSRFNIS